MTMKFYLAPMEGLTGFVFRNAYQKHFGNIDTYFTPFINNKKMNYKEIKDILPEHNAGMHVVPQILTNRAEDFLAIAKELGNYNDKLKEAIRYRELYPETSLQELAEIISQETGHNIGKSGVNHYFIKVKKLAEKHRLNNQ